MNKLLMQVVAGISVSLMGLPVAADFGDGGKWKQGPYGMYWDENDWPEWTPMYWMEEMINELDDDDERWSPRWGGFPSFSQNHPYWSQMPYGRGISPGTRHPGGMAPEGMSPGGRGPWEMGSWGSPWGQPWGNGFNSNRFRNFSGVPLSEWYDDNEWPEWTPMYWMEEFADTFDEGYGSDGYNRPFDSYPFAYQSPNRYGRRGPFGRDGWRNPITGDYDRNANLNPHRLDQYRAAERFRQLPSYAPRARQSFRRQSYQGAPPRSAGKRSNDLCFL